MRMILETNDIHATDTPRTYTTPTENVDKI